MTERSELALNEEEGMRRVPDSGREPWWSRLQPPHPRHVSMAAGAVFPITTSGRHAYMIAYTLDDAGMLMTEPVVDSELRDRIARAIAAEDLRADARARREPGYDGPTARAEAVMAVVAARDAEIEKLNLEIQGHQVSEGYEKGHEHGSAVAAKFRKERDAAIEQLRLSREKNKAWDKYRLRKIKERRQAQADLAAALGVEVDSVAGLINVAAAVRTELEELRKRNRVLADSLQRSAYTDRDVLQLENDLAEARVELDALKANAVILPDDAKRQLVSILSDWEPGDSPHHYADRIAYLVRSWRGSKQPDSEPSEQAEPALVEKLVAASEHELARLQNQVAPATPTEAVNRTELDWHYGPTDTQPDPGRMWHRLCGGEVWSIDDGLICQRCGQQDDQRTANSDQTDSSATRTEPRVVRKKLNCFHPWPGCNCTKVEVVEDGASGGSASTAEDGQP